MDAATMRTKRLFRSEDNRAFVIAFDHPIGTNILPEANDAFGILEAVTGPEVDAVLLTPGLLRLGREYFAHRTAPLALLRADIFMFKGRLPEQVSPGNWEGHRIIATAEDAMASGADAILVTLPIGFPDDQATADAAAAIARSVEAAHRIGLPALVETVLWGTYPTERRDPEMLAFASRFAAELGADAVKTDYTGDPATMRDVVNSCPVPVLTLGGPKEANIQTAIDVARESIEGGAAGLVFGRDRKSVV